MSESNIVHESGIEIRRSIESTDGFREVTLTLASFQTVPVLVRLFDSVPEGQSVLARGEEAETVDQTYDFDRLDYQRVLQPGGSVTLRYARTARDGAVTGDQTTEIAVVTPLSPDQAERIGPAVVWWDGDDAYTVPAVVRDPDHGVVRVDPTPDLEPESEDDVDPDRSDGVPDRVGEADSDARQAPVTDADTVHDAEADARTDPGSNPDPDRNPDRDVFLGDGGELQFESEVTKSHDIGTIPVVGIIAARDEHDSVIRTISRARTRGHDVYVIYSGHPTEKATALAETLGATVVDAPRPEMDRIELRQTLIERAREDGYPGILIQPIGAPPIDYERTASVLDRTGFAVEAIPETWSTEIDRPHVIAAIPAYNAAETVGDVVRLAAEYADLVIVVDDGSEDDTGAVAREAGAFVVEHKRNWGYGSALKTAFKEADRLGTDHMIALDADGQHDPTDIPRLVEAQKQTGAEIVVGSRYMPNSRTKLPLVRRIGLSVVNALTNLSLGRVRPSGFLRDTQSGFRSYSRDAIETLATDPDIGDRMGASTDIIYHAHRQRYEIHEVGTTIRYDVEHSSTLNPFVHGYDLVRNITHTLTVIHPFKTLGVVGGILAALGIGVAFQGIALGIESGQVPFVKTYAAVLVALIGMLFVLVALDYHTLRSHPYYRNTR